MPVTRHLLRPTRELGRATLKRSPIWSCTGWGLPSFPGHPRNWCALTAPFHPYLIPNCILSVALSFALPRLHVMEHPALWCSDFPPDLKNPAIVWTTLTVCLSLSSRLFFHRSDIFSSCHRAAIHYTSAEEYSYDIPGRLHLLLQR